jgi:hypothetical protein
MSLPALPQPQLQALTKMVPSTYVPTKQISKIDPEQILQLILRFILITELSEVPSSESLEIIVSMIVDEYPSMEIGELVIALKKGTTGAYGPLYNKIGFDTIPTWVRKYYDVTWPQIEAQAILRNKQISKQSEITNPVQCPPELSVMNKLSDKLKGNQYKTIPDKLQWKTIEDFCKHYGYDYEDYIIELNFLILETKEDDLPQNLYIAVCHQRHLAIVNKYGLLVNVVCNFLIKYMSKLNNE